MSLSFTPDGIEWAYRHAIFPMYNHWTGGIDWYSPDPRTIIPINGESGFHVSRSLAKTIRRRVFDVTVNCDFAGVIEGCADRQEGTWISSNFIDLYTALHRRGKAHSIEVWREGRLVGGTYGVAFGSAFMAESMFHYETDASKVALAYLVARLKERGYTLLDVQYMTPHLSRFGAVEIRRSAYYERLQQALKTECNFV